MVLNNLVNFFGIFFVLNFSCALKNINLYFDQNFQSLLLWYKKKILKKITSLKSELIMSSLSNDANETESMKQKAKILTISKLSNLEKEIEDKILNFKTSFIGCFYIVGMYSLLIIVISGFEKRYHDNEEILMSAFLLMNILISLLIVLKFINSIWKILKININSILIFVFLAVIFFYILIFGVSFSFVEKYVYSNQVKIFTVLIMTFSFFFYYSGIFIILFKSNKRFKSTIKKDILFNEYISEMNCVKSDLNEIFK